MTTMTEKFKSPAKISKEHKIVDRTDKEIRKTIIVQGDYSSVPYEDSRCKIILINVKCSNAAGDVDIEPESRVFGPHFDGNVIIGDMDFFIDKDIELILQQMCCGETSIVQIIYRNSLGHLIKEITCTIKLMDVTEEQLISDWSWARLYEAVIHHKERGVQLVREQRIVDAFRRFSKSFKMLVAIEPLDPEVIDKQRMKEMADVKIKLYNNLAHCQLHFHEYDAVVDLCSRALKLDMHNVKALFRRSIAYWALKQHEEAWRDITSAHVIDPSNKAVQAKVHEMKPEIDRINKDYTKVIKNMFTSYYVSLFEV